MQDTENAQSANLLDALKRKYDDYKQLSAWEEEATIYPEAIEKLRAELGSNYSIDKPLALGSTATVWKLTDLKLNQPRALKLPRPRLSRLSKIVRVIRGEREKLAAMNHQNIVKIFTAGELQFKVGTEDYSFPYFVMEFLPGVCDLADFIENSALTCPALELVDHFRNVLAGLDYLHSQGIIHCDVKPGNILIAPGRPALITDFGYAKHFPRPGIPSQMTDVTFTRVYGHPDLQRYIKDSTDENATISDIRKEHLKKQFDLYALGKTILETIQNYIKKRMDAGIDDEAGFTAFQRQFVGIVAKRMLDGHVDQLKDDDLKSDMIAGLSKSVMEETKYRTPAEALGDLEKLLGLYSIEGDVPELNSNLSTYVQIPHSRVPLTPRVQEIINHPVFIRLAQVTQLGFVSLVYPGACHTRYEHVLGTFALCCEYVRALWHDQHSPLFQCLMTRRDIDSLLVAALLHDIGQYPMAHDMTEVSSDFAHESFGPRLIELVSSPSNQSLGDILRGRWGVTLEELNRIWSANSNSTFKARLLKAVISGPLDCDKVDYIRRDSAHLGVTFGLAFDHERLLRNITVAYAAKGEAGKVVPDKMEVVGLGVTEKALVVAQSLVRIRKDLFTQVYWHHTVRVLKAMLGFAVRNILLAFENNRERADQFWAEFDNVLLGLPQGDWYVGGAPGSAGDLDDDWLNSDGGGLPRLPSGLNSSDDSLLLFLRKYAGVREKAVIDAMRNRLLFKRLYVLTHAKEEAAFDQIYGRFHTFRLEGRLSEIEQLRIKCERQLRTAVIENIERELKNKEDVELAKLRDRVAAADPLILLDVPVKAVSRGIERDSIHHIPEDVSNSDGKQSGQVKFSSSSVLLEHTPFDKEVGKIRLFAPSSLKDHLMKWLPDHHETITEWLIR